jgi:hypothetical protein
MEEAAPVRIRFLGLFPSYMDLCCRKAPDPLALTGNEALLNEFHREQMSEYPPHIRENQRVVESLFDRLLRDFPRGIAIEVVGLDTFRGLRLKWREKVKGDFAVLVDDRARFDRDVPYEELKSAVSAALVARGIVEPLPRGR